MPILTICRAGIAAVQRIILREARRVKAITVGTTLDDRTFLARLHRSTHRFLSDGDVAAYFRSRQHPLPLRHSPKERPSPHHPVVPEHGDKGIIASADRTCRHMFDLLGSGPIDLGSEIDWHADFITGYRWNPGTYFSRIIIPYNTADIKVPWELSRFSHAVTLGQAYRLTGDEKYTSEFVSQVSGWIDTNKPKFGVNWAYTMDVAIRACNWIAGFFFVKDSVALDDAFMLKFLKSLYQHGLHIRSNLEYSDVLTSNHYLSNISGLVYLGVLFPEFKEAAAWRAFGIRELGREMEKQVYADGCDFEASTCYHRLVLELFFFTTVVVVLNDPEFNGRNHRNISDKVFGKEYTEKLYRMFEAVLYLLKPNGMMPQIGDNDSGRLHVFAGREVLDMRYLLTMGAIFFQKTELKVREFGFCEEALWVFGEEGYRIWQGLEENSLEDLKSRTFPEAGWHIMREKNNYMVISCGPNGQNGNGGHAHNDELSFELCLDGEDIFVDPGTYGYTPEPEMRNLFRSTAYHNTVCIEGMEQNRIPDGKSGLFRLEDDATAKVIVWESAEERDKFTGEHYGFHEKGITHRREICFQKGDGEIVIRDLLQGDRTSSGTALFHLNPDKNLILRGNDILISDRIHIGFQGAVDISIGEYFYSPEYGKKESSHVIKVIFYNELITEIRKING